MKSNELEQKAVEQIQAGSPLVQRHLEYLREMVRIDSRSFGVNEFKGDRETPTDMREILELAERYLREVGFRKIKINKPPAIEGRTTPILMAEIVAGKGKPTVLCYAHLDKQPYMDNEKFEQWGGVPPTELRWNKDRTRAYGRGAADDLAGVTAIGMAVDALLKSAGYDSGVRSDEPLSKLPCNIKVIYETEEESGSHSLIEQIEQNHEFFAPSDCVVITDVINPAQGHPGLTTSLRGIIQFEVTLSPQSRGKLDAQTALYKLVAKLIHDDHSLAVAGIAGADIPVTDEEEKGYAAIPTTVEAMRNSAGLFAETLFTVPDDKVKLIEAQLRKSFVNVRPGHRVSGSIIFGSAGARLTFRVREGVDRSALKKVLQENFSQWNRYRLRLTLKEVAVSENGRAVFDLVMQSASKDPHSGIHGGPVPIAEIQLARIIGQLIGDDGTLRLAGADEWIDPADPHPHVTSQALFVDHEGGARLFDNPSAKALVEIRLAPGNDMNKARNHLQSYLKKNIVQGYDLEIVEDKGASPWMTGIEHPVFPAILEALEKGYGTKACLYGCGGSIPFVAKLMDALGEIPPLCIGAYDPDSQMHEPNESLSMVDWIGCSRSLVHFMGAAEKVFPNTKLK